MDVGVVTANVPCKRTVRFGRSDFWLALIPSSKRPVHLEADLSRTVDALLYRLGLDGLTGVIGDVGSDVEGTGELAHAVTLYKQQVFYGISHVSPLKGR